MSIILGFKLFNELSHLKLGSIRDNIITERTSAYEKKEHYRLFHSAVIAKDLGINVIIKKRL